MILELSFQPLATMSLVCVHLGTFVACHFPCLSVFSVHLSNSLLLGTSNTNTFSGSSALSLVIPCRFWASWDPNVVKGDPGAAPLVPHLSRSVTFCSLWWYQNVPSSCRNNMLGSMIDVLPIARLTAHWDSTLSAACWFSWAQKPVCTRSELPVWLLPFSVAWFLEDALSSYSEKKLWLILGLSPISCSDSVDEADWSSFSFTKLDVTL